MLLKMDLVQTTGFAVIFLLIGRGIKKKVRFFQRYSIPAPIIGGILFSLIHLVTKSAGLMEVEFDTTLQLFFQIMYFCTIGLAASLKVLRKGGSVVLKFLVIAVTMAVMQNVVAVGLSYAVGFNPMLGLLCGSPALVGGTGTTAAIAPIVEGMGYPQALTVGITAATFGILMGSLVGNPIARRLIVKQKLYKEGDCDPMEDQTFMVEEQCEPISKANISMALFIVLAIMFFGAYLTEGINALVGKWMKNIAFPAYIGTMLVAALVRNVSDSKAKFKLNMDAIDVVAEFSLAIFLGIALLNLKLWQLLDMALPMILILSTQVLFLYLYASYLVHPLMGKNYDSAMMSSGLIGFGMGATSNAMANMHALAEQYRYSKMAFFVVPIVGALFIDFFNVLMIFGIMGFIK